MSAKGTTFDKIMNLPLSSAIKAEVEQAARAEELSASAFVRRAIRKELARVNK